MKKLRTQPKTMKTIHRFIPIWPLAALVFIAIGCKGSPVGHILKPGDKDLVGNQTAGAGTFNPLVDASVQKLLGAAETNEVLRIEGTVDDPKAINICFVGIENRSSEELGDFKEQLFEKIDTLINEHPLFNSISRNYVDAGLRLTRLRPDELFLPDNMRIYSESMERTGQPFQYLLYAKLTSGTTTKKNSQQRDYLLTLSMVDSATGQQIKQSAEVRKGYHKNAVAKALSFNPFK
jgi:hypothetical protein